MALAEVTPTNIHDYVALLVQGGVGAGFIYWLTYTLVPRLQKEGESAREDFKTSLKESRTDFLCALKEERESFGTALKEERENTVKQVTALNTLTESFRDLKSTIRDKIGI